MLLLNDGVTHSDSCFYLCRKGKMPQWNNTGVYHNFACANQPVHIPPQYQPVIEKDGWKIFHQGENAVITYSANDVGLLLVVKGLADEATLDAVIKANAGLNLTKQFMLPGVGLIEYRLNCPKNRWVIYKVKDQKVDRVYDKWQRLNMD
jgi:hypothetical protein